MMNFLGSLIYKLYMVIGNYGIVMIIVGIFAGLIYLPMEIEKLRTYKIKMKLLPEIKKIEAEEQDETKRAEKIAALYQENNYSFIKEAILSFLTSIISMVIFIVVFNPYKHIGISETYSEPFMMYDNIFGKTIDIIMPIIVSIMNVIASNFGKPVKMIDIKDILISFFSSFILYALFMSVSAHLYAVYSIGNATGRIISSIILCYPKRKAFAEFKDNNSECQTEEENQTEKE